MYKYRGYFQYGLFSERESAKQLNCDYSTIAGEFKGNSTTIYQVEITDELAQHHRFVCYRTVK